MILESVTAVIDAERETLSIRWGRGGGGGMECEHEEKAVVAWHTCKSAFVRRLCKLSQLKYTKTVPLVTGETYKDCANCHG